MMLRRQTVTSYLIHLYHLPMRYYFVAGVVLVMTMYIVTFREKTLTYNYGGETCDKRLVPLPGVFRPVHNETYTISSQGGLAIGGLQLTASSLCITPLAAPEEQAIETLAFAPWGGWLARFTYQIETREYPSVDASILETPIPVTRELKLPLTKPDITFSYNVEAGGRRAECSPKELELLCDIPTLQLKQGSSYNLSIKKYFKEEKVEGVTEVGIKTLSPLSVTSSSIERDTVVYDKPASVTLAVDKPLGRADFTVWRTDGEAPVEIEASTELKEKEAIVTFAGELPRQATIELRATSFEAADGSTPLDPYVLPFKTSGGPTVTGVNVGSSGVGMGSQIVVTFDQELSPDQDIGPLMTLGGASYQGKSGNRLIFSASTGKCEAISINLKPDIKSPYDISGQSAWQYSGRTACYTVTTIGMSAQGRAINAYHFGSSGPAIIYTGAIHGNELSTKSLMDRWIQELDANPGQIPADKRVIVVPSINPDGVARGSRVNSRNVDLNRNFATSDWQKDIQHTNGSAFHGGGGSSAMSEPETKAIATFIAQQRPELVISYHSIGGLVVSNQGGQANTRASQYASLSGYRLSGGGSGEFGYQITGTADDYYREKLGVPSILIELGSHSYHQFERNQAAMWAMMR